MKTIKSKIKKMIFNRLYLGFLLLLFSAANCAESFKFAAIGDYGDSGSSEQNVADMVDSWNVDFIITLGDNNYNDGAASTIDANIGQYYQQYIYPYSGNYGSGSPTGLNRFWPALGNHDWYATNAQPYLDYFDLPHNERYYDFVQGPIHFFVIDSDSDEPDGYTSNSTQANWIRQQLENSTSTWNIVYMHHAPYSSGDHESDSDMQWPYEQWGADAVLAGHDHDYERLQIGNIPYFVNGLGGRSIYAWSNNILDESQYRYNSNYGAMLIEGDENSITFKFYAISSSSAKDTFTIEAPGGDPDPGNELENGVAVTNLSADSSSETFYTLEVPSGASDLNFVTNGGTGDVDLYVNFGSAPTQSDYDCRPYIDGNEESCDFSSPSAGTWHVMLHGWDDYSGVSLKGSYVEDGTGGDGDTETWSGLRMRRDGWIYESVNVAAGVSSLVVTITGGSGDADLYVNYGSAPTSGTWDCRPNISGNEETCTFDNPASGEWHIGLLAVRPFNNVTATATWQ